VAAQYPQQDPIAAMSASNGSAEIDQRLVWYACVFGAYLSGEITHRAQIDTCRYCGCETNRRHLPDRMEKAFAVLFEPTSSKHRVAYSRVQQTGLTAQEFETDGKEAAEPQQLRDDVSAHLWPSEK
jgi:hypothetical protein